MCILHIAFCNRPETPTHNTGGIRCRVEAGRINYNRELKYIGQESSSVCAATSECTTLLLPALITRWETVEWAVQWWWAMSVCVCLGEGREVVRCQFLDFPFPPSTPLMASIWGSGSCRVSIQLQETRQTLEMSEPVLFQNLISILW